MYVVVCSLCVVPERAGGAATSLTDCGERRCVRGVWRAEVCRTDGKHARQTKVAHVDAPAGPAPYRTRPLPAPGVPVRSPDAPTATRRGAGWRLRSAVRWVARTSETKRAFERYSDGQTANFNFTTSLHTQRPPPPAPPPPQSGHRRTLSAHTDDIIGAGALIKRAPHAPDAHRLSTECRELSRHPRRDTVRERLHRP